MCHLFANKQWILTNISHFTGACCGIMKPVALYNMALHISVTDSQWQSQLQNIAFYQLWLAYHWPSILCTRCMLFFCLAFYHVFMNYSIATHRGLVSAVYSMKFIISYPFLFPDGEHASQGAKQRCAYRRFGPTYGELTDDKWIEFSVTYSLVQDCSISIVLPMEIVVCH